MQTQCPLFARVVINNKLKTVRVLATFDASRRDGAGRPVITVRNADFDTGDIASLKDDQEVRDAAVARALAQARRVCRTDRVVLV